MPTDRRDRRIDRSDVMSVALNKLLVASAARNGPLTAIVADQQGLLVASAARSDDHAERVAAAASLLTWLRETFSSHQVLDGLSRAVFEAPDGERLAVWAFDADGEPLLLGLLLREEPTDELARHLIDGVRRIMTSSA